MGPYWVLLAVAIAATLTLPVAVLVFAPAPLSSQETPAARLVASVAAAKTDRTNYGPGDSANVTVILTNIGLETAVMHFHTPCFVQFLVLDEARHAQFNSSRWWGCVQILADEILAPGESRTWVFPWGLTTDAGGPLAIGQQYEVVPSLLWIYPDYQRNVSRSSGNRSLPSACAEMKATIWPFFRVRVKAHEPAFSIRSKLGRHS